MRGAGADAGFQVRGGGALKIVGVYRVKNHDFTQKKHIFSNFRGGEAPGASPPIGSAPDVVFHFVVIKRFVDHHC